MWAQVHNVTMHAFRRTDGQKVFEIPCVAYTVYMQSHGKNTENVARDSHN